MRIDPGRDALVVVDLQRDFLPGGALAVPAGDTIVEPIARLAPRFGVVVATQDWHPRGHVSFASAHAGCSPVHDAGAPSGGPGALAGPLRPGEPGSCAPPRPVRRRR